MDKQKNILVAAGILVLIAWCFLSPLFDLAVLDSDSRGFLTYAPSYQLRGAYEATGINRILGFAFANFVYAHFISEQNFLLMAILLSVVGRIAVLVGLLRVFAVAPSLYPYVVVLVFAPLFWIDGALILSRAINEFLAGILALGYMVFASRKRAHFFERILITLSFLMLSLVTYESYAPVAVLAVMARNCRLDRACLLGASAAFALVLALQEDGSILRNPKLAPSVVELGTNANGMVRYVLLKLSQLSFSISHVTQGDVLVASLFGLLVAGLLGLRVQDRASHDRSSFIHGAILIFLSTVPLVMMLILARDSSSLNLGKIYWMMLANSNMLFAMGALSALSALGDRRTHIAIQAYTFAWVTFGAMIVRQLAKTLAAGDSAFLMNSLFKGFTSHFGL